jgi:UDP-3-O-[3-hydroxymyristoyl] N-acetylglucosamine deacetylase
MMQTSLKSSIRVQGIGLHSGKMITMTLVPAGVDQGINFIRTDLAVPQERLIEARYDRVVDTRLCTVIGNGHAGAIVGTIEHLMAALRGLNIDNVTIELNGPEVPVMDGSAMPFVDMIMNAGIETLAAPRKIIRVLKSVSFEQDGKKVTLSPSDTAIFGGTIEFAEPVIGRQTYSTQLLNGNFVHDIAAARTFGFKDQVETMKSLGLALGGTLDNAIVLTNASVLNPGGLRFADEFIRHKLLDAMGDLYLAGAQIQGAYEGYKAGHYMNNMALKTLFADELAYEIVPSYSASSPHHQPDHIGLNA